MEPKYLAFALAGVLLVASCTESPTPSETAPVHEQPRLTPIEASRLAETLEPIECSASPQRPTFTPAPTPTRTRPIGVVWDVYYPDPQHLWNRLFRQLYGRTAGDGQEHGRDSLDPLLWSETTHLLEGPSYQQAIQLLDEFLSTNGEQLITDPLKRAMFQRDLWAVFDWSALRSDDHPFQRRGLQGRLVQLIRRLSLTREEIQSLPDNYEAAVSSQVFAASYQDEDPETPFLPQDLFLDGEWVCIGREGGPIAMTHTEEFPFFGRSVFLVFYRVPGGRKAALNFLHQLNTDRSPDLPAGTEVALVRRTLLIDEKGDMILSPIVESVQIRHFFGPGTAQSFYEFGLDRALLFAGTAGGLRPIDKEVPLFRSGDAFLSDLGPEEVGIPSRCMGCHIDPLQGITGIRSIFSYSRDRFPLPDRQRSVLTVTTPDLEARAVVMWKLQHQTWQALKTLWQQILPIGGTSVP